MKFPKQYWIVPVGLLLAGLCIAGPPGPPLYPKVGQGGAPWDVTSNSLPIATEDTVSNLNSKVTACDTGNVTVTSAPLPADAATETTLSSLNSKVTACDTGNVGGSVTVHATTPIPVTGFPSTQTVHNDGTPIPVTGFPSTQTIHHDGTPIPVTVSSLPTTTIHSDGTPIPVTGFPTTQAVSVTTPLPTGSNVVGKVGIDQTTDGTTNKVYVGNSPAVTVSSGTITANQGGSPWQVQSNSANIATETTLGNIKAKTDNIPAQGQALAGASLPVVLTAAQISTLTPPAAISNFANETGGNLASIKTDVDKIPSQGQALAAASLPVVLTAAQVTTLTPPTSVTVSQGTATNLKAQAEAYQGGTAVSASNPLQVSIANTGSNGTAINVTAAQGTATNLKVQAENYQGGTAISSTVPLYTTLVPLSTMGWTPYSNTALSTTKQQIKGTAGQVGGWFIYNPGNAVCYVQVFDLASASVTVGSTTPTYVLGIPTGSGANVVTPLGVKHGTGITVAATTTPTGSSACNASQVVVFFYL